MIPTVTASALDVATLVWCYRRAFHLTVVAKAGLRLVPGGNCTIVAPEPIQRAAAHSAIGEDVPTKGLVDVTAAGVPASVGSDAALSLRDGGRPLLEKRGLPAAPEWARGSTLNQLFSSLEWTRMVGLDVVTVPHPFDWKRFQTAPPDQRISAHLKGDESLGLRGLSPTHSDVRTRLPSLRAAVRFIAPPLSVGAGLPTHAWLRLDTIHLQVDELRGVLIW
ncbi:MAG: DUF2169 domain-containing protein, partial [Myxococcota bacterium]